MLVYAEKSAQTAHSFHQALVILKFIENAVWFAKSRLTLVHRLSISSITTGKTATPVFTAVLAISGWIIRRKITLTWTESCNFFTERAHKNADFRNATAQSKNSSKTLRPPH